MDLTVEQANFAFKLLREIVADEPETSLVCSPVSVSMALSMVLAGARGKTAEELTEALGGAADANASDAIHSHFAALAEMMNAHSDKYALSAVNRAYVDAQFSLLDSFHEIIDAKYAGQFESADFSKSLEIVKAVNKFVKEKTAGKIADLLMPGDIANTVLLLVNAVHFKGNWLREFNNGNTKMEMFFATAENKREVEMMHQNLYCSYYEDEKLQCVELPYAGNNINAYFLLPKESHGLQKLLDTITGKEFVTKILGDMNREKVDLKLPKFRVETKLDLQETLESLGVKSIFTDGADLSGISESKGLKVGAVIQKACIQTDEKGSEAAAATAVMMVKCSLEQPPKRVIHFHANHPFAFALTHSLARTILFSGVICKE